MPIGTLNVALSNYMQRIRNNKMMIDMIAPRVPVDRQSYQYVKWDKSNSRLTRQTRRAPGARPQSVRTTFGADTYFCHGHALEGNVPFEAQQYGLGLGFSEEQALVAFLMDQMTLDAEVECANIVLNPALVPNTQTLSGASMWDNVASDPITVIDAAKSAIRQNGVDANFLIFSDPVYTAVKNHPDIVDRLKYTNTTGVYDTDALSALFEVPVSRASAYVLDDDNNETWVWGESAVLGYSQQAPSQMDISAMKQFDWTAAPGTVGGYGVMTFPDPYLNKKTTISSIERYYDLKLTAPGCLFTFNGCCAVPAYGANAPEVEG
ncbi:hypothetical protein FTO74_14390 [Granulicella sp. WH15]|uniref:hypothetical protein n=1 Tax=Granulicella sp. WH15 TaxID=2602070 RepID=UPI001366E4B1|nr:hypothetical protein [Granulicella sp. WH15]QHN04421.1 hypothetical protein FTO74_14390 [Granulicella sp. WH15]